MPHRLEAFFPNFQLKLLARQKFHRLTTFSVVIQDGFTFIQLSGDIMKFYLQEKHGYPGNIEYEDKLGILHWISKYMYIVHSNKFCWTVSAEVMVWRFVCHPFRNYLRTYQVDLFQISVAACYGPYAQRFLQFMEKKLFRIFFVSVNMGPYGSKNFKMLLLNQIALEFFQTFPEFSFYWPSQKYYFGFLKFRANNFSWFFFFFRFR